MLMFAAMGAGQNTALATDTGKARAARSRVFRILDRVREEELSVNPSYHILYTPFIPLHYHMYTYAHPLYMYLHHIYTQHTSNHLVNTILHPMRPKYTTTC